MQRDTLSTFIPAHFIVMVVGSQCFHIPSAGAAASVHEPEQNPVFIVL